MLKQINKMSEIMKEMAESLLRSPRKVPSSEAAHVALMFANIAWNESVGMDLGREGYRQTWEAIEAENPALWNELKASDTDALDFSLEAVERKAKRAKVPCDTSSAL